MSESEEQSATMDDLIQALIRAQGNIQHATADGKNPYFKSTYATLEQVITAVKGPLNEQGIYFQQHSRVTENGACIETVFYGHGSMLETGSVYIVADRQDPQSFGSALTYAKRYSLSMACGIGHQKDDDGEKAMEPVRKPTESKEKEAPNKEVSYTLKNASGSVLITTKSVATFLNSCRQNLHDPEKEASREIYAASKESIDAAHGESVQGTRAAFDKLLELYGEKTI